MKYVAWVNIPGEVRYDDSGGFTENNPDPRFYIEWVTPVIPVVLAQWVIFEEIPGEPPEVTALRLARGRTYDIKMNLNDGLAVYPERVHTQTQRRHTPLVGVVHDPDHEVVVKPDQAWVVLVRPWEGWRKDDLSKEMNGECPFCFGDNPGCLACAGRGKPRPRRR